MNPGKAARAIAWLSAATLVARHTLGNWQLIRTLAWLRDADSPMDDHSTGVQPPEVHVILPVLREQEHVRAALDWWRQILSSFPGMSLTIVSTAREEHDRDLLIAALCSARRLNSAAFPQLSRCALTALKQARAAANGHLNRDVAAEIIAQAPLTRDVVNQLMAEGGPAQIHHLTYPGLGRKAAQINYAAQSLPATGYIAIYDVDSRPEPELLTATYSLLTSHRDGGPTIIQQHAIHLTPRTTTATLVRGSALLQTLWTLRREIPYARRYQFSADRPGWRARLRAGLSQPVGHGLFMRHDVFADLGGLPESTVLDDVPTGVALTLHGITTQSLAKVTAVPAPDSLAEVVAQGRRWFCSYLDYPAVLRTASGETSSHGHLAVLTGVAAYRAAAWLAASPLTVVAAIAGVAPRSGRKLRAAAWSGLALATLVPMALVTCSRPGEPSAWQLGQDSAELLIAYFVRSVGPWLAIMDAVRGHHPASTTAPAPKAHRRREAAT
ncbi:Glycosyltransferase like family 2 [Sinosporangium album]|uniref:Glycosyltransferase like family 2 n=1 Tax=Sinosporangium album TaxID=504805 RepID=A0A1G8KY74_9ACTN|nr:glycosyltransferase [Sinosporangium album]SDI48475.1 Glycosyltransferase like family 2 [Sinosporangium album]